MKSQRIERAVENLIWLKESYHYSMRLSSIWFKKRSFLTSTVVILSYLMITLFLLYTYPYDLTKQVPGDGGDGYQFFWDLWWVKYSLTTLHSNPYITNYVFYPNGQNLYFHSLIPLGGIITIPFQDSLGLFFSYNFLLILSFAIGGFGAYLLANYFTKNQYASYLSGLIFAFSPYHLAHTLGHLNLISFEAVPFYVLFLFKLKDTPNYKNAVYAAISLLIATFLGDFYYAFMLVIFTAIFLVFEVMLENKLILKREFIKNFMLIPIIFFLASAVVVFPMLAGFLSGQYNYAQTSIGAQMTYSADLAGFFIPGSGNYFFGNYVRSIEHDFGVSFGGAENGVYIGYTVIVLLVYSILKIRKSIRLWLLLTGIFIIFSLGPFINVMGTTLGVPLPGVLLCCLPGGLVFQAPGRFMVVSYLGFGVIVALGVANIMDRVKMFRKRWIFKILLVAFLSALILLEYNMSPYPSSHDPRVPLFYYQLREMKGDFSVLDLPVEFSPRFMYYSAVSEKPILIGSLSRIVPDNVNMLRSIPLVSLSIRLFWGGSISEDELLSYTNETSTQENLNKLVWFNVRYIILHKQLFAPSAFDIIADYLTSAIGEPCYVDRDVVVFEV